MTPIRALTAIVVLSKIYPIALVKGEIEKNSTVSDKMNKNRNFSELGLTAVAGLFNNRTIMDRSFQAGIIIIISSIIIPERGAEEV